jgi:glucose/arabinose dehydrogenase
MAAVRLVALGLVVAACSRKPPPGLEPRKDIVVAAPAVHDAAPAAATIAPDAPPAPPREPPPPVAVPADVAAHVALKQVLTGLRRPVDLVVAPGDAKRMFIVEQRGRIRIVKNGKLVKAPFFTIDGLSDGNEQGLLGLAFHPRFADNRQLYVDYTTPDKATHVVEYKVSAKDPDRVDPTTARELLVIEHPYSNHNGGNLVFGPDGKLWMGMGDGGSAGDPHDNGQNPQVLLGKLIRLDVDGDKQPPAPEITAIGMRNPWRFSFDAKTGDLYIGDVGQDKWESVYALPHDDLVGHNFGWSRREGRHCFKDPPPCANPDFVAPVVDYAHGPDGCSVTGGFVYRGKALPALDGVYFYGDFCTGRVWSFRWTAAGGASDHWAWKDALDAAGALTNLSSFGVDADGELYLLSLDGNVFQLVSR